ncbi:CBS domain-containing protein [Shewanella intestini]|uniref:CBS domain-containing protein n=1 Tax=Shewanella intestini TaxID=2017544 RepID=A0ABS5I1C8_9GAMM|nr:CBS domain-containing protein [Shewanella sp. XMDDZSB0408]MBR9727817.1 CBS domain-containing protein [Shewanella intestini]MRG36190.1 CBS domain-containing protein [Shewanella sp. XMDDZSB0408]
MNIKVADIMTTPVVTIAMDDRLVEVKNIFDHVSFHHLIVLDADTLVGVLSYREYLAALSPRIGTAAEYTRDTETLNKRVHQVMKHFPQTISADQNLIQASELILANNIDCLPVIENNQVTGIITWKDVLIAYKNLAIATA